MNVVGKKRIADFSLRHADAKSFLNAWVLEVEDAQWSSPQSVKQRYQHASFRPNNRIIFNIRGNNYRLVADVDYETKTVLIVWIGTHEEYSRKTF